MSVIMFTDSDVKSYLCDVLNRWELMAAWRSYPRTRSTRSGRGLPETLRFFTLPAVRMRSLELARWGY